MLRHWTFGKRLAAGFGFATVTLVIIVVLAYRNANILIENDEWVTHTHEVRTQLGKLLLALLEAQSGERGYIITGEESRLEASRSASVKMKATFDRVRQLTSDNPEQQRRWETLSPVLDARLAELRSAVDSRRTGGFEVALKVVQANLSKGTMDQAQNIIDAADQAEETLLAERSAKAVATANAALAFILWGGLAGALAIAAIGWLTTVSLSRQIGSAIGRLQSASAELQAAANQQASGAREQATAMNEISTTINELLVSSRQIAESVRRVADTAEQTAGTARSGHGTVETTYDSISGIRRQVDQVVSHMLDLGKKSQEIGSVLEIVSELSEQTNILAINATIEAMGAGDSGRRFAAVADEIRKLADRVGGSTKEIRALIDDVRSAVNTTVMATESGSKAVDTGSRQFGEVASAFKQISTLVVAATDAAREIELSTKQQATAVEQVNIAIANVAQASRETEASAGQTSQTVSQLTTLSSDLLRIIRPHLAA